MDRISDRGPTPLASTKQRSSFVYMTKEDLYNDIRSVPGRVIYASRMKYAYGV